MYWNVSSFDSLKATDLPADFYPTCISQFPKALGGQRKSSSISLFVVGTADGKFHFLPSHGRIEKTIEAHKGAVLCAKWSHDGAGLATGGEDGQVKIWSRNGMLRSTLSQTTFPIYSMSWSPLCDAMCYTFDRMVIIKSLAPNTKPMQWTAHSALILQLDWSVTNKLILTSAEDTTYKLWDNFGRLLYTSHPQDYPITSLAWSPDGDLFALGSFNTLRLCDKAGWSQSLEKPNVGSLFSLCWSDDGTQVAAGCGNGEIIFAHINGQQLEWEKFKATVTTQSSINVLNVSNDTIEKLDFKDRIIKFSLAFSHLVVLTTSQCHIYSTKNWNTPIIFELKDGNVTLIQQCQKLFLLVDGPHALIYTYDGKLCCSLKWPGMRPDFLTHNTLSLSNDLLAVLDRKDLKGILIFDVNSGKQLTDCTIQHPTEICQIALNQCGSIQDRQLTFIDRNSNMYLCSVKPGIAFSPGATYKLGNLLQSMVWNESNNMLATLQDSEIIVWYYPRSVTVDKNITHLTSFQRNISEYDKNPVLVSFSNNSIVIRKTNGALVSLSVSPYPAMLQEYIPSKWNEALRLCRFVKDTTLWACLATMSLCYKQLEIAEMAYAALNIVEKVHYIQHIQSIGNKNIQFSEMALLAGNRKEAEMILMQNGLLLHAIMQNIDSFRWERSLELAMKHQAHIPLVLGYRQKYIADNGYKEDIPMFLQQSSNVKYNWNDVLKETREELSKEQAKATR